MKILKNQLTFEPAIAHVKLLTVTFVHQELNLINFAALELVVFLPHTFFTLAPTVNNLRVSKMIKNKNNTRNDDDETAKLEHFDLLSSRERLLLIDQF
jgi:hypothetical protein